MKRVVVRTEWNEADGQIVVGRLRLLGIDATLEDGLLAASAFDLVLAERGGIKIRVPEDQVERANAELRRIAAHEPEVEDGESPDGEFEIDEGIEESPDVDEVAAEEIQFQSARADATRWRRIVLGIIVGLFVSFLAFNLMRGIALMSR